jgi:F-type H+-transporting ATPase subunit epsilon
MDNSSTIRFSILLPTEILLHTMVSKVVVETDNGVWCLLLHHIDFVAALVPGILVYVASGQETFVAVDEGILVKCGSEVRVSTRQAVCGPDLGCLKQTIEAQFCRLNARETLARAVLARLEADTVRRFVRVGMTVP